MSFYCSHCILDVSEEDVLIIVLKHYVVVVNKINGETYIDDHMGGMWPVFANAP